MPCQSPNLAAFAPASANVPLHRQRPCHLQPNHHAPPSGPTAFGSTGFNHHKLNPVQLSPQAPTDSTTTGSTWFNRHMQAPPGNRHKLHPV
nr:hypothetical protein Iba_chr06eCG7990 [Ipomoea batatas]